MQVKDFTIPEKEYKGKWTEARGEDCPCRPSFNAHDCGYYTWSSGGKRVWKIHMECATRWNNGCDECLKEEPVHIPNKKNTMCKRCKMYLKKNKEMR